MSYTNRGAEIPMDRLDVAFQPHRHGGPEVDDVANDQNGATKQDGDKKSTNKGMLDANAYATKKTIAQGLLDVALLTANASQLKYLLQVGTQHEFYHLMLSLISISIILQIAVGVIMFMNASYDITEQREMATADRLNNLTTMFVFFIVAINIFIAAFGMTQDPDAIISKRNTPDTRKWDDMNSSTTSEPYH